MRVGFCTGLMLMVAFGGCTADNAPAGGAEAGEPGRGGAGAGEATAGRANSGGDATAGGDATTGGDATAGAAEGGSPPNAAGGVAQAGHPPGQSGSPPDGQGGASGSVGAAGESAGGAPPSCLEDADYVIPVTHHWSWTEPHFCAQYSEETFQDAVNVSIKGRLVTVDATTYLGLGSSVASDWDITKDTSAGFEASFQDFESCGIQNIGDTYDASGTFSFDCNTRKATVSISCLADVSDGCENWTYFESWNGSLPP